MEIYHYPIFWLSFIWLLAGECLIAHTEFYFISITEFHIECHEFLLRVPIMQSYHSNHFCPIFDVLKNCGKKVKCLRWDILIAVFPHVYWVLLGCWSRMVDSSSKYCIELGWSSIMPPVFGNHLFTYCGFILHLFLTVDQTEPAASAYSLIWEDTLLHLSSNVYA